MSHHNDIYQNCYCGSAIITMPSWDVVNDAPLQWKLAEGGLSLLVYIIESVCLFVRSKRQNYGTDWCQTLRNYEERPGKCPLLIKITHLSVLEEKSWHFRFFLRGWPPFYLSHFHLRLLPWHTNTEHFCKMASIAPHIAIDNSSLREPFERKSYW